MPARFDRRTLTAEEEDLMPANNHSSDGKGLAAAGATEFEELAAGRKHFGEVSPAKLGDEEIVAFAATAGTEPREVVRLGAAHLEAAGAALARFFTLETLVGAVGGFAVAAHGVDNLRPA
jgi:hypothetical protein